MFKRPLVCLLVILNTCVFANTNSTSSSDVKMPSSNPSAVGSRQGSNQVFGEPKVSGKPGKDYYTHHQVSHGKNASNIGSLAGSNQVFGEPKITGKSGENYYKHDKNLSDGPNKPTQGSRAGSNQVFGEPAITHKAGAIPASSK